MTNYIDGFVLPVPRAELETYKAVVMKVAEIWKEYGAQDYTEYVADDITLQGTRSFESAANGQEDEVIIFGWVAFASRDARDLANEKVAADPRMESLVNPLINSAKPVFDLSRMIYGGFRPLFQLAK
jgi:uncharacterized protein YbaA (DUF1428 family)